jgi:hypothetical protein
MRSSFTLRRSTLQAATILAVALVMASVAPVAAKRPPKPPPPPPPSPTIQIEIAASGMLEPNRQYAHVDVTVTCPAGWTWTRGGLYVRQADPGGSGSFAASCTGAPQTVHTRVVNGNKWVLGTATATAFVTISQNGQETTASSMRSIRLEPMVTARVADQGQLTGTSGGGVKIAISVACPSGTTGLTSGITVSQNGGTAQGAGSFTPICDGQDRTFVVSITASRGTFVTGSALADAFVITEWESQGFYGFDSRTITLLQSSTGDTTPPSTPSGLSANVFSDGETWLSWGASTDNATPSGLIVYEVFLNGRFDQGIGGGYTEAILYADLGVLNTIEVVAIDGAGNRSAPASVTVDCTHTFGCT